MEGCVTMGTCSLTRHVDHWEKAWNCGRLKDTVPGRKNTRRKESVTEAALAHLKDPRKIEGEAEVMSQGKGLDLAGSWKLQ